MKPSPFQKIKGFAFAAGFLILGFQFQTKAQTASDIFKDDSLEFTWLGIDFSRSKIIGDFNQFSEWGSKGPSAIRDEYFPAWNSLVFNEPTRYDLRKMMRTSHLKYDMKMVEELNANVSVKKMESYNTPQYSDSDIQEFVGKYPLEKSKGVGMVLIIESFNKPMEKAISHFVLFSMETKKILIQERFETQPVGFGLRNYWAGSFHEVFKRITNNAYVRWRTIHAK